MSSKKANLFLEEDVGDRVFEIRIRDLRKRESVSQRSFSVMTPPNTKNHQYATVEELKEVVKEAIRKKLGGGPYGKT